MPFDRPPVAMVATDCWEALQVANVVRSCVPPLLKVPVAVNGWVVWSAMKGLASTPEPGTYLGSSITSPEAESWVANAGYSLPNYSNGAQQIINNIIQYCKQPARGGSSRSGTAVRSNGFSRRCEFGQSVQT
jgi:hypothetical protein